MSIQQNEVVIGGLYEGPGGLQKRVTSINAEDNTVTFVVVKHGEKRQPPNMAIGDILTKPIGSFCNWVAKTVTEV